VPEGVAEPAVFQVDEGQSGGSAWSDMPRKAPKAGRYAISFIASASDCLIVIDHAVNDRCVATRPLSAKDELLSPPGKRLASASELSRTRYDSFLSHWPSGASADCWIPLDRWARRGR
jgi:hypothetical protein